MNYHDRIRNHSGFNSKHEIPSGVTAHGTFEGTNAQMKGYRLKTA
jgi:hypothetical protein